MSAPASLFFTCHHDSALSARCLVRSPVLELALTFTVIYFEVARAFLNPRANATAQCVLASRYCVCAAGAPLNFDWSAAVPYLGVESLGFAPYLMRKATTSGCDH
jgi:hypothetical protein